MKNVTTQADVRQKLDSLISSLRSAREEEKRERERERERGEGYQQKLLSLLSLMKSDRERAKEVSQNLLHTLSEFKTGTEKMRLAIENMKLAVKRKNSPTGDQQQD